MTKARHVLFYLLFFWMMKIPTGTLSLSFNSPSWFSDKYTHTITEFHAIFLAYPRIYLLLCNLFLLPLKKVIMIAIQSPDNQLPSEADKSSLIFVILWPLFSLSQFCRILIFSSLEMRIDRRKRRALLLHTLVWAGWCICKCEIFFPARLSAARLGRTTNSLSSWI